MHPSPESRLRAIDGKEVTSDSKPAASPVVTSSHQPFGFPDSDATQKFALRAKNTENKEFSSASVSFAQSANFRVAENAENRRLRTARANAVELARAHVRPRRPQSPAGRFGILRASVLSVSQPSLEDETLN